MLFPGARIALVNSSNACPQHEQPLVPGLVRYLESLGLVVEMSPRVMPRYEPGHRSPEGWRPWDVAHAGTDEERAAALMEAFADPDIAAVFDISGGDLANGVLRYLDWAVLRANPKPYAGYSDLSTHLNAFLVETGEPQIYWRILPLGGTREGDGGVRGAGHWGAGFGDVRERFEQTFVSPPGPGTPPSFTPAGATPPAPASATPPTSDGAGYTSGPLFHLDDVRFVRGTSMAGPLVGGNLRCTLKLAGTRWFPDLDGSILAIETESNPAQLITTLLTHFRELGAFERCAGLLIGQQNHLTEHYGPHAIEQILDSVVDTDIPIARTEQFGHRHDSRALLIGGHYEFSAASPTASPARDRSS